MRRTVLHGALVLGAIALVVVTETVGYLATAPADRRTLTYTIAHTSVGVVFALCAGIAWRVSEARLPPRLMIATAYLWLPQPLYAAIGHVPGLWPPLVAIDIVWAIAVGTLVLIYPSGRPSSRLDAAMVLLMVAVAAVRAVAAVLLDARGPVDCVACSVNPYLVARAQGLYDLIDDAFRLLGGALIVYVAVRVVARWLRSSPPARAAAFVMPVALILWAFGVVYQSLLYASGSPFSTVVDWVSIASDGIVPIVYVAGIHYIRALRGRVADLMLLTRGGVDRHRWESMLAQTLRDPALRVFWWEPERDGFVDSAGRPARPQAGDHATRKGTLLPIGPDDGVLAMVDHDSALLQNGVLLDGISSALLLSVDNDRLRQELERTLDEVRSSRVRIIEAAMAERTRIERDLHDGSQQALVSIAIGLRMAADRARSEGSASVGSELDAISEQLSGALRSLRELARGIHPTSLALGGLGVALPELASACPVSCEVDLGDAPSTRFSDIVEATVYFVVAESLTNAAKHAAASGIVTTLRAEDDELVVRVADDGRGGALAEPGGGLSGLRDRVEALGGSLAVDSETGVGTTVTARIPTARSGEGAPSRQPLLAPALVPPPRGRVRADVR